MRRGYFPGCSLHSTARECGESLGAIAGPLGLALEEIEDWSCCGATSAHATNHLLAIALAARNLSLAEAQGIETVMTPCAACYSRLSAARHEIAADGTLAARVGAMLERPFANRVEVESVVEVLRDLAPAIKEKATRPLRGLKIACYYGCLLVRPEEVTGFDDVEQPTSMETVVEAAGAEPVRWHRRLDCCGGGFALARTGSVVRLGREIVADAKAAGAHAIAVACPMCQSNLDLRQRAMALREDGGADLPILFLTQIVGLALGIEPARLGLRRHFVDTAPVVERGAAAAPSAGAR